MDLSCPNIPPISWSCTPGTQSLYSPPHLILISRRDQVEADSTCLGLEGGWKGPKKLSLVLFWSFAHLTSYRITIWNFSLFPYLLFFSTNSMRFCIWIWHYVEYTLYFVDCTLYFVDYLCISYFQTLFAVCPDPVCHLDKFDAHPRPADHADQIQVAL